MPEDAGIWQPGSQARSKPSAGPYLASAPTGALGSPPAIVVRALLSAARRAGGPGRPVEMSAGRASSPDWRLS